MSGTEDGIDAEDDPADAEAEYFASLLEPLAELEHEQWIEWSRTLAEKEKLSPGRLERWAKLWVPYSQLPEEVKEQDRVWARKAIAKMAVQL